MGQKYATRTSILGKLISMLVARHGAPSWKMRPLEMSKELARKGIEPVLPDEEIEAALAGIVDSGELVNEESAAGPKWEEAVSAQLHRVGAVRQQRWELTGEMVFHRVIRIVPVEGAGEASVFDERVMRDLFNVPVDRVLPALKELPDNVGTHFVVEALRNIATGES